MLHSPFIDMAVAAVAGLWWLALVQSLGGHSHH